MTAHTGCWQCAPSAVLARSPPSCQPIGTYKFSAVLVFQATARDITGRKGVVQNLMQRPDVDGAVRLGFRCEVAVDPPDPTDLLLTMYRIRTLEFGGL